MRYSHDDKQSPKPVQGNDANSIQRISVNRIDSIK